MINVLYNAKLTSPHPIEEMLWNVTGGRMILRLESVLYCWCVWGVLMLSGGCVGEFGSELKPYKNNREINFREISNREILYP